jgi:uncharacterized paraquat-inducible protein A
MLVSLPLLIAVYVMVPLACLTLVWLYDAWRVKRRHFVPTTHVRIVCEICLHQFMADKDERLPKCPQCGSRNRRPEGA